MIAAVAGGPSADGTKAGVLVAEVRAADADGVKVIARTADGSAASLGMSVDRIGCFVTEAGDLDILVAPYDLASVRQLAPLSFSGWKIDAPLLTHLPLLEEVARDGRPVLAGVAGCTKRELDEAVRRLPGDAVLVHTLLCPNGAIDVVDVAHLTALQQYGRAVGYADSTRDTGAALTAVALGATFVEKPLAPVGAAQTDDRDASLSRDEFRSFVARVRRLEQVRDGDGARNPKPDELDAIEQHRVSIVAARPIPRGTALQREMLTFKAPAAGLSPRFLPLVEGRRVLYDIPEGALVTFGVIEP